MDRALAREVTEAGIGMLAAVLVASAIVVATFLLG
jgi:hypothetical protein